MSVLVALSIVLLIIAFYFIIRDESRKKTKPKDCKCKPKPQLELSKPISKPQTEPFDDQYNALSANPPKSLSTTDHRELE